VYPDDRLGPSPAPALDEQRRTAILASYLDPGRAHPPGAD